MKLLRYVLSVVGLLSGVVSRAWGSLLVFASMWLIVHSSVHAAEQIGEWPEWRGSNRDNISKETGWLTKWPEGGPKVLWQAEVGVGYSNVAIAAGRLYTMGNSEQDGADGNETAIDTVWCLDAKTGSVIWKHSYPCLTGGTKGPYSTPTVDGKLVYTLSKEGHLFCLDAASGKVVWAKHLVEDFGGKKGGWHAGWAGFVCAPLVVGNVVIVEAGAPEAAIIGLDKSTGAVAWKFGETRGDAGQASPMPYEADGRTCVAVRTVHWIAGLDPTTGEELWRYNFRGSIVPVSPVVFGDRVFNSTFYGGTFSFVIRIGSGEPELVWKNKNLLNYYSTSVLWDGYLYGMHAHKRGLSTFRLRCVDFDTGEVKWECEERFGGGSAMVADGKLLILGERGDLVVAEASPRGYKELARAVVLEPRCWNYPVLASGRIYARNHKGNLVCLDVSGK